MGAVSITDGWATTLLGFVGKWAGTSGLLRKEIWFIFMNSLFQWHRKRVKSNEIARSLQKL
jgi:hypothetical protein